ncbi:hypothetical protein STRTUCAR8_02407, partial [Streptomyces turgidiscabies Car8]
VLTRVHGGIVACVDTVRHRFSGPARGLPPVADRQLFPILRLVHDLDQVAAGVVEHSCGDRAHLPRLLGEAHAPPGQPVHIGQPACGGRQVYVLSDQRALELSVR